MSITVVNLQDNRAVFRIFIALLRFSFDFPSYKSNYVRVTAEPSQFVGYTTLRYVDVVCSNYVSL